MERKFFDIVQNHTAFDEAETREKQQTLQFLSHTPVDLWGSRESLSGHLTASAWVVNKDRTKVLFAYHNIYQAWAWLGGHADGDLDLLRVAEKEALEESGISGVKPLIEAPLDISVDAVQAHIKRGVYVPPHLHFNSTFLFEGDEAATLTHRPDENAGVAWIHIDELLEKSGEPHIIPTYARIMKKVALRF